MPLSKNSKVYLSKRNCIFATYIDISDKELKELLWEIEK